MTLKTEVHRPAHDRGLSCATMEDLLANVDLDPIASPIGLLVIFLGIRIVMGSFKTAIKLVFVGVILIGAYLFFFGGTVT